MDNEWIENLYDDCVQECEFIKSFPFEYKGDSYVLKTYGYKGFYCSGLYRVYSSFNKSIFIQHYNSKIEAIENHEKMIKDIKNNERRK